MKNGVFQGDVVRGQAAHALIQAVQRSNQTAFRVM